MDDSIRPALAEALAGVGRDYARVLAGPSTDVAVYATRFLTRHRIYRVDFSDPPELVAFYVGYAQGGPVYLLTGQPEEFGRLAAADGVAIDDPAVAAEYAAAFLETTRTMAELFYVVRSVDDVPFRPNLNEERQQVRADAIARFRETIAPPRAEPREGVFAVTVYAVREQALERHELTVGRNGGVVDNVTTLEAGLPLVYGS